MKRLVQVLSALSLTTTIALAAAMAKAQDVSMETIPLEPASTSAMVLDGLESRKTSLDFQLLFLPDGAGGERNADGFYYEPTTLIPVETTLEPSEDGRVPIYARVEPNRAIRTQTDPQRLVVTTPLERQHSPMR